MTDTSVKITDPGVSWTFPYLANEKACISFTTPLVVSKARETKSFHLGKRRAHQSLQMLTSWIALWFKLGFVCLLFCCLI